MTEEKYIVEPFEGKAPRADAWLAQVSEHSRSRVQKLFEQGNILCNGEPLDTLSHRLQFGECYTILVPDAAPTGIQPENIPLDILYEDKEIVVVNKPPQLVVHPAPGHESGTLVNALLYHYPGIFSIGGEDRPGIVHRLDQDTSGALIIAKTDKAIAALQEAFQKNEVKKTYKAIVHGVPYPIAGRIETNIGRNPQDRKKMCVLQEQGRNAITEYTTERDFGIASLVSVNIETGRTHQIRVHMNYLGNPVVGDQTYGSFRRDMRMPIKLKRQMLHAAKLEFMHPVRKRERVVVEAPLPADMKELLGALKAQQ